MFTRLRPLLQLRRKSIVLGNFAKPIQVLCTRELGAVRERYENNGVRIHSMESVCESEGITVVV